ncbi:hypothetical protein K8I61_18635 [bacterium]|nr:hypothetical protein [bacterium]
MARNEKDTKRTRRIAVEKRGEKYVIELGAEDLRSIGVDLDKPLVDMVVGGDAIRIVMTQDEERRERFTKALEETHREYAKALKRLAE